jgi:MOSC domain-containing protein YiiM
VTVMGWQTEVEIVALLASPLHRYEGRPKDGPLPAEGPELHDSLELRTGLGIVGDRYFAKAAHVDEAVTIMAAESLDAVAELLETGPLDFTKTRRNILVRGLWVDDRGVDSLRGSLLTIGDVVLRLNRPANPCAWMDEQLAPGAHRALLKRGGMRCSVVQGGILRIGRTIVTVDYPTSTVMVCQPSAPFGATLT